eukprot:403330888
MGVGEEKEFYTKLQKCNYNKGFGVNSIVKNVILVLIISNIVLKETQAQDVIQHPCQMSIQVNTRNFNEFIRIDEDIQALVKQLLHQQIPINLQIEMPIINSLKYRISELNVEYDSAIFQDFNMVPDGQSKTIKITTPRFHTVNVTISQSIVWEEQHLYSSTVLFQIQEFQLMLNASLSYIDSLLRNKRTYSVYLRQINAFSESMDLSIIDENINIYLDGVLGLVVDYVKDTVTSLIPDFVFKGADFTAFIIQELFKIFPVVIDFYNYFGNQMKILQFDLDYLQSFSFSIKRSFFSYRYIFDYMNVLTLFEDFEVSGDIMRIASAYYEGINPYVENDFMLVLSTCFDDYLLQSAATQVVQNNYGEITIGKNFFFFVEYYLSSGQFYELMPYILKQYQNREMYLKVAAEDIQISKISVLNNYRTVVNYKLYSYINSIPNNSKNTNFINLLEETGEIRGDIQLILIESLLQVKITNLRMNQWSLAQSFSPNITIDSQEDQRLNYQKNLDYLQANLQRFGDSNTYFLPNLMPDGLIRNLVSKFKITYQNYRMNINLTEPLLIKVRSLSNNNYQSSQTTLKSQNLEATPRQSFRLMARKEIHNHTHCPLADQTMPYQFPNQLNITSEQLLERIYFSLQYMADHYADEYFYWDRGSWFSFQIIIANIRIAKLMNLLPKNQTNNKFYMQTRAFIENKVFSVDEILFAKTLRHRNQWHWFMISGSDDLGWACLALFYAIDVDPAFKDTYLNYNGPYFEKGVRQILQKIDEVYRDSQGRVFWLGARDIYYSCISVTLTIIINQKMYLGTQEQKFLNQAQFDYKWITDRPYMFNQYGLLMDGENGDRSYFDQTAYTYNQGALIMVYGQFYEITGNASWLKMGIRQAKNAIKYMSNENLIVREGSNSQKYMMGIYFRFLSEFARTAYPIYPQEIQCIRDYILRNADYLWNYVRGQKNTFPGDYLKESETNFLSQNMGIELLTSALAVLDLTY